MNNSEMQKSNRRLFCNVSKMFFAFILVMTSFVVFADDVSAGFGVSPPYINNKQLVPGSSFEQVITLLRSAQDDDLVAQIELDAPEISSWITFPEEVFLPKGELQVPMTVRVDVPSDAEIGHYTGYMNVRITPADNTRKAGVAIALGARIDVDLTLTNISFSEFRVKIISVPNFEMLEAPWSWPIFSKFLHRIRAVISIDNSGNTKISPTKVTIDVYDITKKRLLESSEDRSLAKIQPFSEGEIEAYFPTKLGVGQYWSRIKIYKENEIVNSYEIAFTIANPGEGTPPVLGALPWILLSVYSIIAIIIIILLIKIKFWRYIFHLLYFLFLILAKIIKPFINITKAGNRKFWSWMAKKASKYNGEHH